jgi:hypothetical protein
MKAKIKVSNTGKKNTQYHYKSSSGALNVGSSKEISIDVGDTLYFENDSNTKYVITENDNGKTFYYSK